MPSSFASLDTGFPDLNKYESTEKKLQAMEDYLVQLLEQIRYALHNISVENLNTGEVTGWLGEVITDPIMADITDIENGLSTRINANADAITAEVTRATGAESTIRQTADGIKAQVTDGQGNYTVLNLKSDALYVGNSSGSVKIGGGNITDGSVGTTQIAGGAITTAKLDASAVTTDKLNANAVTTAKIAAGAVTADELASNSVTTAKIVSGAVTANEIAANTITAAELAAGAVTTAKLAAGAVTAGKIAADAINGFNIYGAYYHDLGGNYKLQIIGGSTGGYLQVINETLSTDVFKVEEGAYGGSRWCDLSLGGTACLEKVSNSSIIDAFGPWRFNGKFIGVSGQNYGSVSQRNAIQSPSVGQIFFVI